MTSSRDIVRRNLVRRTMRYIRRSTRHRDPGVSRGETVASSGNPEEDGESAGMRAARIRSNIADVYGVICGELASPSSGLNSAISGKENSLIKLGQLFLPPPPPPPAQSPSLPP